MGNIPDNQHEAADPLRPDRCPDCGYLLTGLPEQGICPECGTPYDTPRLIVLYGWTSRMNALGPWGWWRFAVEQVALGIVFFNADWLQARLHIHIPFWIVYGLFAGAVSAVGMQWCRRWLARNELQAPELLRLSPAGFGARTGYGQCSLHPWETAMQLSIRPWRRKVYRLEIYQKRAPHALDFQFRFHFQCDDATAKRVVTCVEQWRQEDGT